MLSFKMFILKIYLFLIAPFLTILFFCIKELIPKVKSRWELEKWQFLDETSQCANICFEVSSEGELEQVLPLIYSFLKQNKEIELIFCSHSVKAKVLKLRSDYPKLVRLKVLPLISYLPWGKQNISKWIKAKRLVLCRYDFFPELLYLGLEKKFMLISATLKNKSNSLRREGTIGHCFLKIIYGSFDLIIPASEKDKKSLMSLKLASQILPAYDFRVLQIKQRLERSELSQLPLVQVIQATAYSNRLILGSCWEKDIEILRDIEFQKLVKLKQVCVVIVPHLINEKNDHKLTDKLVEIGLDSAMIKSKDERISSQADDPGKVYILSVKGVLCELYQFFGHAYVGGGFDRSIHSVLEPFVAGCSVYCGPKVGRSTEFDLIKGINSKRIRVLTTGFLASFFQTENMSANENWLKNNLSEFKRYEEILND